MSTKMHFQSEKSQTLLALLQEHFPDSSKSSLREWIEHGRVSLNDKKLFSASRLIDKGEKLFLAPRRVVLEKGILIVYEDDDLIVIDKPAGLLSVATDYEKGLSAHDVLKRRSKRRVYPVHRLDRDTSGVMVFTYTDKARQGLKDLFEIHDIEREYRAVVHGHMDPPSGKIESTLKEDAYYFVRSSPDGKLAITHYETIEKRKDRSLLKLKLETGRKNQIRAQLSEFGHPVVGDEKYGGAKAKRLFLHAMKLGFRHPVTLKAHTFNSACPF